LHIIKRELGHRRRLFSIYLVNRLRVPADEFTSAEYHLFQPQVRVVCDDGTNVVPGLEGEPLSDEDRLFQFLYRERPVLARGHLCSAIWKAIDPERPYNGQALDVAATSVAPPFRWQDAEVVVDAQLRQRFASPDVRTEYVPLLPVSAPELSTRAGYGDDAVLDPEELAETWESDALRAALAPLVGGYRQWIRELEQEGQRLPATSQPLTARLIAECLAVAQRIERGIELLVRDQE